MIHETGTDATDPIPYMMTSLVMIQYDKIAFEVHLQYTPILKFVFIYLKLKLLIKFLVMSVSIEFLSMHELRQIEHHEGMQGGNMA